ncbi:HAD family hydrolase [Sporanaerobium hydrogeniformans]|uniref:HAD family hydrolase n=1 Tax=Sporanaerobium hydrogeniformans TaxID=3072179 RepID=UPI0015D48EE5|nr:HAD-IB family hydrolase [Sporanaerobium hydrogeniformans]
MKLAIFDFDGTLFPKQTIPYLMKSYIKLGYSKARYAIFLCKTLRAIAKYKLPFDKKYGKEQFRREATVYFIQLFNKQKPTVVVEFFHQVIPQMIKDLNPMVVEEVRQAKARGEKCVLLSGCYTDILKGIAEVLGIDYVIGTDIEWENISNGKRVIKDLDISTGPKKVERLLESMKDKEIDWNSSRAYGDSEYDRYILEIVGNPIAVNPDELLRKLAEEKRWEILTN